MSAITWAENIPSGTSQVGQFPAFAKSVWTSVALGMATEHYWDGSGGASSASAGELLPGGSRAFFAAQSASSAPNSQMTGRAFLASDVSRLLVYDSNATRLAGTPFYDEGSGPIGSGFLARQSGSFATTATSGSTTITFGTPYLQAPLVFVSVSSAVWFTTHGAAAAGTVTSRWSALAATGGSIATFYWESYGTVSSASFG